MNAEIKVEGITAGLLTLEKQLRYAVAITATAAVKEAQLRVIAKIQETFVTRNPWFAPSNRYGIHFKPATVEDPSAELSTNAYWLVPHETGALKEPSEGPFLAVPTRAIHPNAADPIPRPRSLNDAFVLDTRNGPKIFQRINNTLRVVYNLVHQVRIAKESTVIQPTIDTVTERFGPLFGENLQEALRTAK